MSKQPRRSEHAEQAAFVARVRASYSAWSDFYPLLFFAVPNGAWLGGKNPWALMNKFKAEGVLPGVSDILYLAPRGDYNCLAIELKSPDRRNDKNAVSDEQAAFLAEINAAGGNGQVCYGADEAMMVFDWYMSLPAA